MAHEESLSRQQLTRERIELMLPGIQKIWVHSRKGGWCLKGSEDDPLTNARQNSTASSPSLTDETPKHRKWWQFWK